MKLSKNFTSDEFLCSCGCGSEEVSPILIIELQRLRNWVGEPIYITSGVRCKAFNAKIGGHPKSAHLDGEAADIYCKNVDIYNLAIKADLLGFKRIGLSPAGHYIHVDIKKPCPSKYWVYDQTGYPKYFKPPKTIDDAIRFCKLLPHG